jgi:hypothetical protein
MSSLYDHQKIEILYLFVMGCPIESECVFRNGKNASICRHFHRIVIDVHTYALKLLCIYKKTKYLQTIERLQPVSCPAGRQNCWGCIYFQGITIPSEKTPQKSLAHILCGMKTK